MDNNNQINNGNQFNQNGTLNNQNYNNNVANNQVYYDNTIQNGTVNTVNNQTNYNNTAQNMTVNDVIYSQAYYNNVVKPAEIYAANNQVNYNNTTQTGTVNNSVNNPGNVGVTNTMNQTNNVKNSADNNANFEKLDKVARQLCSDFVVLGVFVVIILVLGFLSGSFNFFNIIHLGIIIAGHSAAKELKPSAGTFGIIIGVLLIISFSIIDLLLGIFVIVRSVKYNSLLKKVG